jgi:hypothetical protein
MYYVSTPGRLRGFWFGLSLFALLWLSADADADSYTLKQIGLTNTEAASPSNYFSDVVTAINDSGEVVGIEYHSDNYMEQNAWVYLPASGVTQQIGLTGQSYNAWGFTSNTPKFLNNSGLVAGYAVRYDVNELYNNNGRDAWVYSPLDNSTHLIGLTDAGHVRADGYAFSQPLFMNSSDLLAGTSDKYSGSSSMGTDAWIYAQSSRVTAIIGLTDSAHTQTDGYSYNVPLGMNSTGMVVGSALRFNASAATGSDTWVYDPSTNTTRTIGLPQSSEPNVATGVSLAASIDDAGDVIGVAERYSGSTDLGQDLWLYSSKTNTTQVIGLTDAAHTFSDGSRSNSGYFIGKSGEIGGSAYTSSGSQDAWVYSPVTRNTTVIGLLPSNSNVGNQIVLSNDAGEIVGTRSGNGPNLDSWVYTPADQVTRQIGLTDPAHLGVAGRSHNEPTSVDATGMVAGFADGIDSGGYFNGYQDAWIYDPATLTTYPLVGSVSPDGESNSQIEYLADDGTAVGWYDQYFTEDDFVETAFRWTEAGGLQDLGTLAPGDLNALGWAALSDATTENNAGQIAGRGPVEGGIGYAYLATPTSLPEPVCLWSVGISALALGSRRKAM